ncbi:laccase-14-like isoform X2 [Salvia splendens]|uniref:laccase-14-like isoform X2 n=1 Tax=Salvia splendens TaxID=180675 RepID=UPI001C266800|nr:laccase-14-like isoform X2 [Salvia splendens]
MFSNIKLVFTLCFLGFFLGCLTKVNAAVHFYRFEVVNSAHTRLCTKKTMLTVNGQFPGPTIYARRGDLVTIDVVNRADQNISIHWKSFRQQMILSDEEGTLWWHAHSAWSRNSVHGAIVILPPTRETYPFPKPHAHVPVIIGEWWNSKVEKVYEKFLASGDDPEPSDAFLINGQPGDLYPCSKQDTYKLQVEYGKRYLIKLINAAMNNIMFFKISNHNFTVVGADGAYTKPVWTDYAVLSPGQTLDLLVEANQPVSHYYMAAKIYASGYKPFNTVIPATAVIEYAGKYMSPPLLPSFPEYNDATATIDFTSKLRSLGNEVDVPKEVEETLFYTLAVNQLECTKPSCEKSFKLLSSINNVSMLLPTSIDILQAYYRGISGVFTADFPDFPPSSFDYTQGVTLPEESAPRFGTAARVLEYNTSLEIVFQGTNNGGGEEHPMHLHGHSFYVVGSGLGNYDRIRDPPNYNLVDPPLMENIAVPKNGWTAIRFKANNPGVWYMHCHIERHLTWGMGMVFIVRDGKRPDEKMLPPPPNMPSCGREPSSPPLAFGAPLGKREDEAQ